MKAAGILGMVNRHFSTAIHGEISFFEVQETAGTKMYDRKKAVINTAFLCFVLIEILMQSLPV